MPRRRWRGRLRARRARNGLVQPPVLNTCSICLEGIVAIGYDSLKLMCNHEFHFVCIVNWISSMQWSCPLCRSCIRCWSIEEHDHILH